MKLFLYPGFNGLSEYFQEEDYNIPFLGGTLFEFVMNSYKRFSEETRQDLQVLVPALWDIGLPIYTDIRSALRDEYEIVFVTHLFNIPLVDFSISDYQFLIQNPGRFFQHEAGFQLGYVNKFTDMSNLNSEDLVGFSNVTTVTPGNFLRVNQSLVNNYVGGKTIPGSYGLPVIAAPSESIVNSKICAPCFIGEDVKVFNSVVYPGTILTGRVLIQNSEVFESFICESTVKNSAVKNSLVVLSELEGFNMKDSVAPKGSVLINDGKR